MKEAHAAVTRLLAFGFAFVLVPKVEEWDILRQELAECDVEARIYGPAPEDLRAIRGAARLSEDEFATLHGFDPLSVRSWENGTAEPAGDELQRLWTIAVDPETAWTAAVAKSARPKTAAAGS